MKHVPYQIRVILCLNMKFHIFYWWIHISKGIVKVRCLHKIQQLGSLGKAMSSLVSASPTSFQGSSQVKWRAKPVVRQLRELQCLPTLHCYCLQYTLYTAHSTLSHRACTADSEYCSKAALLNSSALKWTSSTLALNCRALQCGWQPKSTSNIWQCIIC